ncbi:GPI mannosyltransferase 4 [Tribolium madens]|uniref:GPI mannosyltransferase 4 n=1 Tax=Tribolium madens TaxID=41895 RepID=UPI001CF75477|nr:GPI mannosyltransferase 4 [Tribolium madens]
MFPELPPLYWYLALARIILVLIPQFGYIHPDEFFQTIEVQAGKAFHVENNIPWEFNATFPVRSVTIPYFTIGMVYKLANIVEYFLKQYSTLSIITPYLVVVGPRLLMCTLSFLVDTILYKICINNNEKYKNRLVILASSYVIIVYGTRTFSNTFELVLFALLQYYVCESLVFSNTLIKKREYLNYRYETSRTVVEKAKFHKLKLLLTSDSLRNCLQISVITVLGFFNRPTFLAFAMFPVFFWLYRGLGNKLVAPMNYHLRILALIVCSIPTIFFSVIIDSFYYGYITWGEVGVLHVTINNFVFTPLNFILYNIDSNNLAKHGLHPRFLHLLVNMPLLFNLLALFAYLNFCQAAYNFVIGRHQLLPTVRSIKGLMMLSYLGPLAILSIFPHQEPRFLIPLILPLVYLCSNSVFPECDNVLIKATTMKKATIGVAKTNTFIKLWIILNLVLVIFFGFLHQGGVYQSADFLYKNMKRDSRTEYYVVTSHIYSLPKSLVLQKSSDLLHYTKHTKYTVSRRFFLYEKGSSDLDLVVKDLEILHKKLQDYRKNFKSKKYKLILIIPSSLEDHLTYSNSRLEFKLVKTFYPHISTEAFPDLAQDLLYFYSNFRVQNFYSSLTHCLSKCVYSFGLSLYEIQL